jgi:hypothetical protein
VPVCCVHTHTHTHTHSVTHTDTHTHTQCHTHTKRNDHTKKIILNTPGNYNEQHVSQELGYFTVLVTLAAVVMSIRKVSCTGVCKRYGTVRGISVTRKGALDSRSLLLSKPQKKLIVHSVSQLITALLIKQISNQHSFIEFPF